jgi:hypothetical protein
VNTNKRKETRKMEDIFGQTLRDIAGSCSWFEVAEEAAIEKVGCNYCSNWDDGTCPFYLRRQEKSHIMLAN